MMQPFIERGPLSARQKEPKTIYDIMREQFVNSGMHGIYGIVAGRTIRQEIFWSIFLMTLLTFGIIHSCLTWYHASSNPLHYRITYRPTSELSLPDFTICSEHGLFLNVSRLDDNFRRRREASDQLNTQDIAALIAALPDMGSLVWRLNASTEFNMLSDFNTTMGAEKLQYLFNGDLQQAWDHVMSEYMVGPDKLFKYCLYREMVDRLDCAALFRPIFNVLYGPCLTANLSGLENMISPFKASFWLSLRDLSHVGVSNKPNGTKHATVDFYLGHEQWFGNFYTMFLGTVSNMHVTVRKIRDLGRDNKCSLSKATELSYFQSYSPTRCFAEKLFLNRSAEASEKCQWMLFQLLNPQAKRNKPICNQDQLREEFQEMNLAQRFTYAKSTDSKLCIPECDRWDYEISYRGTHYVQSDQAGDELISGSQDETVLQYSYASSIFTVFEEEQTLTWTEYLSMFGGLWGLWLGCSIVTWVHIFGAIFYFVFEKIKEWWYFFYQCEPPPETVVKLSLDNGTPNGNGP